MDLRDLATNDSGLGSLCRFSGSSNCHGVPAWLVDPAGQCFVDAGKYNKCLERMPWYRRSACRSQAGLCKFLKNKFAASGGEWEALAIGGFISFAFTNMLPFCCSCCCCRCCCNCTPSAPSYKELELGQPGRAGDESTGEVVNIIFKYLKFIMTEVVYRSYFRSWKNE